MLLILLLNDTSGITSRGRQCLKRKRTIGIIHGFQNTNLSRGKTEVINTHVAFELGPSIWGKERLAIGGKEVLQFFCFGYGITGMTAKGFGNCIFHCINNSNRFGQIVLKDLKQFIVVILGKGNLSKTIKKRFGQLLGIGGS